MEIPSLADFAYYRNCYYKDRNWKSNLLAFQTLRLPPILPMYVIGFTEMGGGCCFYGGFILFFIAFSRYDKHITFNKFKMYLLT